MEENQGYVIRQSVLFENNRGFALGENFKAPNPFVTWQFTLEDGQRDYYWGHYFNEECMAIGDYNRRVFDYEQSYEVKRLETSGPDFFKYYSTQRPVDIGTFPKLPRNTPDEIVNYDQRIPVEGGAFVAWGHLTYTKPLTEKQASDYELRPAPNISELRRESCGRPRPIAQQMKEAAALTEANRGDPAPKKKVPDRGDR